MKGFLTNAILASVFRARNSCISSLFAISGTAHNCCKGRWSFRSFFEWNSQLHDAKCRWNRCDVLHRGYRAALSAVFCLTGTSMRVSHLQERFQQTFSGFHFIAVHVSKREVREQFLWAFDIYKGNKPISKLEKIATVVLKSSCFHASPYTLPSISPRR